jgi:cupin fold WbuC family metalloprotein
MANQLKYPDFIAISKVDLDKLIVEAENAILRRARICLHKSHDDPIQEMIIAFCQDSIVPIHRHTEKTESFHVIQGVFDVAFYDDAQREIGRLRMGDIKSGYPFSYRLSSNSWHTIEPLSEHVIVHEIVTGPFIHNSIEILTCH